MIAQRASHPYIVFATTLLLLAAIGFPVRAQAQTNVALNTSLVSVLECLSGHAETPWGLEIEVTFSEDRQLKDIDVATFGLERLGEEHYRFHAVAGEMAVSIDRTANRTALQLPKHDIAYIGQSDPISRNLPLDSERLIERLVSKDSLAFPYVQMLTSMPPKSAAPLLIGLANLQPEDDGVWRNQHLGLTVRVIENGLSVSYDGTDIKLRRVGLEYFQTHTPTTEHEIDRVALETMVTRGVHRATEILLAGPALTSPAMNKKAVENGQIVWVEGQRVALLSGSPEQIGKAHGQLLAPEMHRVVDSTLYTMGLIHTVMTGRWFPEELESAWVRLEPYIPEAHLREMDAAADAGGIDRHTLRIVNVFPELFHCSGFAVFDSATAEGKLYHGRVLDYMTYIGLHHTATVFVVRPDDAYAYVNIGYAGFLGSVTGMNEMGISLGEMGGSGEGDWDGVPMATLMRLALETCGTLDDVKALWQNSPRTCEYFYVWADGKTNEAVGVTATPEKLEFVHPGEMHSLLGEGISDAVVLSSGARLKELRRRVIEQHGELNIEAALRLMDHPVAMNSNLHNVLFVPADLVFYVAHTNDKKSAWQQPYIRLDMHELLMMIDEKNE